MAAHIDDLEAVGQIAARFVCTLLPEGARTVQRAFKRDVTRFGFRGCGLDALEVAHRSVYGASSVSHVPGRVLVLGDSERDHPRRDVIEAFLGRGGTVLCEGAGIGAVLDVASNKVDYRGATAVTGPLTASLFPGSMSPAVWLGEDTRVAISDDLAPVLHTRAGTPVVSLGKRNGGTVVHTAFVAHSWRLEVPADAPRTTLAAFAARLGVACPCLPGDEDTSVAEPLLRATITMQAVVCGALATAMSRGVGASSPPTS